MAVASPGAFPGSLLCLAVALSVPLHGGGQRPLAAGPQAPYSFPQGSGVHAEQTPALASTCGALEDPLLAAIDSMYAYAAPYARAAEPHVRGCMARCDPVLQSGLTRVPASAV